MARPRVDPVIRFWQKVERTESCWIWHGTLAAHSYGQLSVDGRNVIAHRFAYELLRGPIPAGLQIDHLCRNPRCVNPDHLEPVTAKENILRSNAPSAVLARRTHCNNGHPFTPDNIYWHNRPNGQRHRMCRTCALAKQKALNERKRKREVA